MSTTHDETPLPALDDFIAYYADRPDSLRSPMLNDAETWLRRLRVQNEELLAALKGLHDDIAEYACLNNIGGFDNHWMRAARAAISKAQAR